MLLAIALEGSNRERSLWLCSERKQREIGEVLAKNNVVADQESWEKEDG